MKKPILNLKNNEVGNIDLDSSIFGLKSLPDIIHQYIRFQNAKSRQGSHKTKSRSEVSGKSKKPFAQKVTVNAYRIESKSLKFSLKTSISHPANVGPPPRPIIFKIKKNRAVDIARIFIGANV